MIKFYDYIRGFQGHWMEDICWYSDTSSFWCQSIGECQNISLPRRRLIPEEDRDQSFAGFNAPEHQEKSQETMPRMTESCVSCNAVEGYIDMGALGRNQVWLNCMYCVWDGLVQYKSKLHIMPWRRTWRLDQLLTHKRHSVPHLSRRAMGCLL